MTSHWAGSSHYTPYSYLPPRRSREVNAATPLLDDQRITSIENAGSKLAPQTSSDTMNVLLERLSFDVAPRTIDALNKPHNKPVEQRLQMQIDFAMQQYESAESHNAQALLRAALQTAVKHDISVASLLDTGGASPLYVALLHHDVSLARDMIQAKPWASGHDLPLLRACVATQDLQLFDAMLPHKLPPAAAHAQQGDADAIVEIVEAIFDTQNATYIASALCILLTQEKAFSRNIIEIWRTALDDLVARDEPLFSTAWVLEMSRSPRSRAPQPLRVCRQNLVRGFCQSLLKRDDAANLIAHLTPAMRRYALQSAMYKGQFGLCRALVAARASESAHAIA